MYYNTTVEISIKNLTLSYYGKNALHIDNLSFSGALGVLGSAGAGKTNLVKAVAGLEFIDSGEIFVGGEDVCGLTVRMRNISLVSEMTPLFANKSVLFNLMYPLKKHGNGEAENIAASAAAEYGLPLQSRAGDLDEGKRADLYLCRAFLRNPKLVVFDEPQNILGNTEYLNAGLKALKNKKDVAIIYTSYDFDCIKHVCDNFLVLRKGEVAFFGGLDELQSIGDKYIKLML